MVINHFVLGSYETNSYILRESESSRDCLIVDTGLESRGLIDFIAEHKLNPSALVLTHGHADHISGLVDLRENFPEIKVYIHKLDADMLRKPMANLSILAGAFLKVAPADVLVDEPFTIEHAGIKLEVIHTPGHTGGGICLYAREDSILFSGDTLFAESVGRTDLPGGSMEQLIKGIKEKLCVLPDETMVLPGHGPSTTIEEEKKHNQYLQ